ncbi:MAG: purine-nucleoside phosphorylase [Bacteroidetes bacterium SW_4_67_19]|jgi:purine-nucleoside phosphorylase|nr:MAG: purine-nucleoside phosphorylase [Bacteroidetes bacterium SW_4_67_19]
MPNDTPDDAASYRERVDRAADAIRQEGGTAPATGIILGTGLGALTDELDAEAVLAYDDLPGFPASTVESHEGQLLFGELEGVPVAAMQGRFHLYEGYSPKEVAFPVRVLATLGVETLLISNAAGGMDPHHERGDLVLITDHINLQGANPLTGPNEDDWGPRFLDMSEPYDPELRDLAKEKALDASIPLHEGVYLAVVGPMLETKAEYRYMRQIGGDVVGMSTVPEVLAARHMGVRCMAISVVTDECLPDALDPIDVEAALAAAGEAEPKLTRIVKGVVREIGAPVAS